MKKQMHPLAVEARDGSIFITQDQWSDHYQNMVEVEVQISPEQVDSLKAWLDEAAMELDVFRQPSEQ